jgi:hypothetical protein
VSARDQAIDELARVMGVDRTIAAGCVDALVLAAVTEAGCRVAEGLIEPLAGAVSLQSDSLRSVLRDAHRELCGEPSDS